MTKRKWFFPIVLLLLLFVMFLSLRYGAVTSKWSDVIQALLHAEPSKQGAQLVRYLRLPRMLGAILVGAGFAIAGALIFDDFCGVRFISLNLSTSLPERTPQ